MTDDINGGIIWSVEPPASVDPSLQIEEILGVSGLSAGDPQLGAPTFRVPPLAPAFLQTEPPYLTSPTLTQVPVPIPLRSPNRFLGSSLLYPEATGFEKALADVDSERITSINAELIRDIWDPYKIPARLLPYLAWAMSVEYWNDDWSETTKRAWIAYQLTFKSIRGTQEALERVVDYAGRDISRWGYKVTGVLTKPQKVFSGPSLTKEEREAWLERLPQVRVWRLQESGKSTRYKSFYGGSALDRSRSPQFCLGGYITPSTAIERLKRRARWIQNGVETDIRVEDFGSYFQLHREGNEDGSVFSGRPFNLRRYYIPSTAAERLITIQPTPQLPWRSVTTPTLQAVTSEPERVTVAGDAGLSVFSKTPLRDRYFIPTTAPYRIFERFAVLDPSVRELRRTPVQFMGEGRFNFPSFTAWASVTLGGELNPMAAGIGFMEPKRKFFIPHDGRPIDRVSQAAIASKALRDKIMLQTGPEPKFVAGRKPVLAGISEVLAS